MRMSRTQREIILFFSIISMLISNDLSNNIFIVLAGVDRLLNFFHFCLIFRIKILKFVIRVSMPDEICNKTGCGEKMIIPSFIVNILYVQRITLKLDL